MANINTDDHSSSQCHPSQTPTRGTFSQSIQPPTISPGDMRVKLPGGDMTAPASIHPRPHMPAFSPPKFADSRLQRMYETGDYSDLIFVAGLAETFRVHKSIVCPASAWFRNACGTGSSRIDTAIDPDVVNSIFCHLYDTEVPLLSVAKPSMAPTETAQGFGTGPSFTAEDASDDLHNVVKLMYASKIWHVEGLVAESKQVLASKLQLYKPFPEAIASTAAKVYEVKASFDAEFDSESRKLVAKAVVQVLKAIMDNEDAEKHLTEDPELMRDVIALAAERLHTVQGLVAQPTNVEPRVVGLNDAQMWNVSQDVSTPVHSTPVTKRPGEALESEMRKKSKDNSA